MSLKPKCFFAICQQNLNSFAIKPKWTVRKLFMVSPAWREVSCCRNSTEFWLHGTVPGPAGDTLLYWVCEPYHPCNTQNILHFKTYLAPCSPLFSSPNSSSTSTALVEGLINAWLKYQNHLIHQRYLISQRMLRSILSRTPKMMISLKMGTGTLSDRNCSP